MVIHAGVGIGAGIYRGSGYGSGGGDCEEIEFEVGNGVDLIAV